MIRSALPAGYVTGRERGAEAVALPSALPVVMTLLQQHGTLYGAAAAQARSAGSAAFTGRGAAYRMDTQAGPWVVRHYRRGGAVARVLDDRYATWASSRPLRELAASHAARERGVRTPLVAACVTYAHGLWYRADIATALVPDAQDLAEYTLGPTRAAEDARVAAWHAAGMLLRTAFLAGIEHADLNMRNLLVQRGADGVQVWLLDLDRAVVRDGSVSDVARNRMLARLERSRRKLADRFGVAVGAVELHALRAGLEGG